MSKCQCPPGFYQYETADLLIELERDGVLFNTADVIVSIVQGSARLDLHKADLIIDEDASTIGVHFTQEMAGGFTNTSARVQVNILYANGERDVSAEGSINVFSNLYRELME